jgi:hypothetical protein|uniref:Nuclear pore complex protein n=1 Tax=Myoviridae sp. ctqfO1 TaxID=2827710 RepID=A0A8S5T3F9_9CAUD|nr:MAG TPA: nuclear pore complex protein [Myoviridae sp. ctqfO1]
MTLEELIKALGLEGEENKEKVATITKEFNAITKLLNTANKKVKTLEDEQAKLKETSEKFDIVSKAFDLNLETEDFDKMLDDVKDKLVKEAGGGTTPEEIKILKRDFTKAQRELEKANTTVRELSDQLESEKTQRINAVKRDAIQKALVSNRIIKPEQMIDLFFGKVDVDKDGSTLTMKDAAGNEISVVDGIADWAKANPEFVQKETRGGAGSGSGANGGKKDDSGVDDFVKAMIADKKGQSGNGETKSLGDMFG